MATDADKKESELDQKAENGTDGEGSGLLLIVSGPSGAGKTTIAHDLERKLKATFSVSLTTRPQAATDREGIDYFFVDRETFIAKREAGELLEWAEVFENLYGTPRAPVEAAMAEGKVMILEIDVEGAKQVKSNFPDLFALFVLPPSDEILLNRLRDRKREGEDVIQRRYAKAQAEIEEAKACGIYDHFVVNDDLNRAVTESMEVIQKRLNKH